VPRRVREALQGPGEDEEEELGPRGGRGPCVSLGLPVRGEGGHHLQVHAEPGPLAQGEGPPQDRVVSKGSHSGSGIYGLSGCQISKIPRSRKDFNAYGEFE